MNIISIHDTLWRDSFKIKRFHAANKPCNHLKELFTCLDSTSWS
jgi:hypothetical protein